LRGSGVAAPLDKGSAPTAISDRGPVYLAYRPFAEFDVKIAGSRVEMWRGDGRLALSVTAEVLPANSTVRE